MPKQKEDFIPKTKTRKRLATVKAAKKEEIPKDLEDQWAAVIATSTAHKLLQEGHFTYAHRNAVGVAIAFLSELYDQTILQAYKHPKQEMIPEIATVYAQIKARSQDGQSQEQ